MGAAVPWDVQLARNQLMNRLFIESIGHFPWSLGLARNKYERIESALSIGSYLSIGIALPLLLESIFNKHYSKHLQQKYGLLPQARPLNMPFEMLEHNGLKKLWNSPNTARLRQFGIKSARQLTPQLVNAIRLAKTQIVFTDLMLLAAKGQFFWFAKNWLTEKLSGKKGFSGEFNYASEEYRAKKSENYEKNKKKRFLISTVLGFGSSIAFPILLWQTLKSKAPVGKGIIGQFKKLLPYFNYSNAIFMSKWLLFYETLFNYNLPKLMSSRDSHEFRENMVKGITFDFFYFFGDAIFSGFSAAHLQKKYGKLLKGVSLAKTQNILGIKLPVAVPYHTIFEQVGQNMSHPAFKLARKNFWWGMLATTACLSVTVPLINMWYTKQKVLKEQTQMMLEKQKQNMMARQQLLLHLVKRPDILQSLRLPRPATRQWASPASFSR